jgi:hypothetical protein
MGTTIAAAMPPDETPLCCELLLESAEAEPAPAATLVETAGAALALLATMDDAISAADEVNASADEEGRAATDESTLLLLKSVVSTHDESPESVT